jgi:hypothetical protein
MTNDIASYVLEGELTLSFPIGSIWVNAFTEVATDGETVPGPAR